MFCTYFEWGVLTLSDLELSEVLPWGFPRSFVLTVEWGFTQWFCTYFEWGSARPVSRCELCLKLSTLRLSHYTHLPTTQPYKHQARTFVRKYPILTILCATRITVPWVSAGTAAFIRFLLTSAVKLSKVSTLLTSYAGQRPSNNEFVNIVEKFPHCSEFLCNEVV